jgi:microcystin-dependent protein/uncharacterized protein YerC
MHLARAFLHLRNVAEVQAFLRGILAPDEIRHAESRWQAIQLLIEGVPQRRVGKAANISIATVSRAAHSLRSKRKIFMDVLSRKNSENALAGAEHALARAEDTERARGGPAAPQALPSSSSERVPFLGEIRCTPFNFAPKGWALCNGQLLTINENQALFSLLGTTYGGNGQTNFALPNLQGAVPTHMRDSHTLGECADSPVPVSVHGTGAGRDVFPPAMVGNTGGSQPHANLEPYGTLNFCIALSGIFPPKN